MIIDIYSSHTRIEPLPVYSIKSVSEEPKESDTHRLEDGLKNLEREGCQIIYIETKVYLDNPHYLSYEVFKSKAFEAKHVIVTQSDTGTILLVQIKNDQWIWAPS
jgi:hypothetical protein